MVTSGPEPSARSLPVLNSSFSTGRSSLNTNRNSCPNVPSSRTIVKPPTPMFTLPENQEYPAQLDLSLANVIGHDLAYCRTKLLSLRRMIEQFPTVDPFESDTNQGNVYWSNVMRMGDNAFPSAVIDNGTDRSTQAAPMANNDVQALQEENLRLKRQLADMNRQNNFQREQLEEKDRRILNLISQMSVLEAANTSWKQSELSKNAMNAATQTERVTPRNISAERLANIGPYITYVTTMNFWDKVQHEIQTSGTRLIRGRKSRRESTEDSGIETPGQKSSPSKINMPATAIDDDLGLADEILASPVREAGPKTGQKARGTSAVGRADSNSGAPPRARRTGGWAEDAPPKSARRRGSTISIMEDVAVNRVATFKELDSDLFRHGAFATLDDIDLRALLKCMAPEPETKEFDSEWTWDALFTEVSSEILKEQLTILPEDEEDKKRDDPSAIYIG
ncbi:unnamed protein product [Notodromas monacha]|uniref:Uncharacterized protein n=1 Tax=Notodromas monacha TaxID=399045 RepID=A0A7R9GHZ7_9CRUS|nr:unnamed protein product [Notodromas monacha]CAG0921885.1 unnamed protein product [Notodromas monacha]